jgi:putative endonuclease
MYTTYILYSKTINRYYTGSTGDVLPERIRRHNSNHSGFTGKTNDWVCVYFEEFSTIQESRSLEKSIKKRGISWFLESKGI